MPIVSVIFWVDLKTTFFKIKKNKITINNCYFKIWVLVKLSLKKLILEFELKESKRKLPTFFEILVLTKLLI